MTQFIKNYAQFLHNMTKEIRKEAPKDEDELGKYLIDKMIVRN